MSDHSLNFAEMAGETLPSVVSRALAYVAEHGLPGDHHFYISFRTNYPGTEIPEHLREHYPNEMTIVLQHEFWNLKTAPDAFAVTMSFSDKRHQLRVPYESIITFTDPSVPFEIRFNHTPKNKRETVSEDRPTQQDQLSAPPDSHPLHLRRHLRSLLVLWQRLVDRLTSFVKRNPTRVRNVLYLSTLLLPIAAFLLTSSAIVRALMLMVSINFVVRVFLGDVLRRLLRYFSERYAGMLAGGSSVLIATSFYLVTAKPTGYEAVIAWTLFGIYLLSFGLAASEVFSENWLVGRLYNEYKRDALSPRRPTPVIYRPIPVVYVASERGLVETYCVAPLMRSLYKTVLNSHYLKIPLSDGIRQRPLSLTKYRRSGGRQMALFVIGNFLRPTDADFRRWLVQNADGFIAILAAPGLVDEFDTAEFREAVRLGYCYSKGRSICIEVSDERNSMGNHRRDLYAEHRANEEYHLDPLAGMLFQKDTIAAIADFLASNTYVNFLCDSTLDDRQQEAFDLIRKEGLPIIADTVLPIRLGSSCLERFTALLEALEVLLVVTVLVGYISRGDASHLQKEIGRWKFIPFGKWVGLAEDFLYQKCASCGGKKQLYRICSACGYYGGRGSGFGPTAMSSKIFAYLNGNVSETVYSSSVQLGQFLDHPLGSKERIKWFQWLRDIRNKTRGHGIFDEERARNVWAPLFQSLLSEFRDIGFLVFHSKIEWCDGENGLYVYKGWKRAGVRARSRMESTCEDDAGTLQLRTDDEVFPLNPWIIVKEGGLEIRVGFDKSPQYKRVTTGDPRKGEWH